MKKAVLIALFALAVSVLAACGITTSPPTSSPGNTPTTSTTSPNTIVMGASTFSANSITITKGSTITFTDDPSTGTMHELVNGTNGVFKAETGAPDFNGSGGKDFKPGDSWTTGAWNAPGVYHVTCVIHPATMNLTVTVTG